MTSPQHLVLQFTQDNPSNTTITSAETGKVAYNVITTFEPKTVTKLVNANDVVIASWRWNDHQDDVLTWATNPPIPAGVWLQESMIPFKHTVTFTVPGGTDKYKWKGNEPGSNLELFSAHDSKSAVARFKPSHKFKNRKVDPPTEETTPAQLTIASSIVTSPSAEELQDIIVTSFLMLERKRRIRDVSTVNRADVLSRVIMAGAIATS
ncbi:hypothetical protein ONZ45_g11306 [Pleurotus djamor]|nr:hypothetical protein ONZ45_g11306 [Pleurotus djamor]